MRHNVMVGLAKHRNTEHSETLGHGNECEDFTETKNDIVYRASPVSRGTFVVCGRKEQPCQFLLEQCTVLPVTEYSVIKAQWAGLFMAVNK